MDDAEHSGAWTASPGGGIEPMHATTADAAGDRDPDDLLLLVTPPWIVAALGFDPREFLTAAELEEERDRLELEAVRALIAAAEHQGDHDGGP